jgi:hypothetical protein
VPRISSIDDSSIEVRQGDAWERHRFGPLMVSFHVTQRISVDALADGQMLASPSKQTAASEKPVRLRMSKKSAVVH